MKILIVKLDSPLGPIHAAVRAGALVALGFEEQWPGLLREVRERFPGAAFEPGRAPAALALAFERYWEGDARALDALAADPGGTAFQRRVWAELRGIPAGATASYAEIARRVGAPEAVRAVGAANGRNPVALVIPCHRVIGADGSLTGYAGGLERKRRLLEHEGALAETR